MCVPADLTRPARHVMPHRAKPPTVTPPTVTPPCLPRTLFCPAVFSRVVAIVVYGGTAAYAIGMAKVDMFREGPHDDRWEHYAYIAFLWFVINISLALVSSGLSLRAYFRGSR